MATKPKRIAVEVGKPVVLPRGWKPLQAAAKDKPIIGMSAPVEIAAAEAEGKPPRFTSTFYTGGKLNIEGWDLPVVVDLSALDQSKVLVANLDHDKSKRVGNFAVANDGKSLVASGTAHPDAFAAAKEVVTAALGGYQWQSSLEVNPKRGGVQEIKAGKPVQANGQTFEGPLYLVKGRLTGFGFVSHGADDDTSAHIAANAAPMKGKAMNDKAKAWAESMGIDVEAATPEAIATIEANYEGRNGKPAKKVEAGNPFEARKLEAKRQSDIRAMADQFIERRPNDLEWIEAVEKLTDHAIEAKMEARDFKAEMYESAVPLAHTVRTPSNRDRGMSARVLEAALCQAGHLVNIEKHFDDQTLQAAHDRFRDGIGLNQLFIVAAESNGYRGTSGGRVNKEVLRAAFNDGRQIQAQGWSTIDIATIVSNTANKFMREGWMGIDPVPLRLASVRSVRDFKQTTTVSLTGANVFEEVGPAGEIKHGSLGETTYNNQARTYAIMLAITRVDQINDDLGALTTAPRRVGRGGALKLADLFWSKYLGAEAAGHISSGNANFNELAADMTSAGLTASEALFMSQTDPDGKPLYAQPKILVVPTALHAKALALMTSEKIKGDADEPDGNVWRGRFRVETSPTMHNSAYTGFSASEWYMQADPNDIPFIEIAALNGRVEPIVETADADFNTLGIQMRGISDVGVEIQEYRAIVKNDGGTS